MTQPERRRSRGGIVRPGSRLDAAAALVPPGSRVADVGGGSGALAAHLLASGRAAACIATERTARLARELTARGPRPGLEVRCGDGLAPLQAADRLDVLVMTGFGGQAMAAILDRGAWRRLGLRRLVFGPHGGAAPLRRWIGVQGLGVVAERMIRERGRFYVALAAEPGAPMPPPHPRLTPGELLEAGPCLAGGGDPLVTRYWQLQAERYRRILDRAAAGPAREAALAGWLLARKMLEPEPR
jgi:tRNA (adenine22-N1)-methyltransferase